MLERMEIFLIRTKRKPETFHEETPERFFFVWLLKCFKVIFVV